MSTKKFLYDELDTISKWVKIEQNVPVSVAQNLNQKFVLRPYQVNAFARFFHCYKNDFPEKNISFAFFVQYGNGEWQDANHGRADFVFV